MARVFWVNELPLFSPRPTLAPADGPSGAPGRPGNARTAAKPPDCSAEDLKGLTFIVGIAGSWPT
jgi:hypothetical protein